MGSKTKSNNISSGKRAANSVSASENLFFTFDLFDHLPDMIFLLNESGEIINLNKRAEDIFNKSRSNRPSHFLDLVDLCNRENVNSIFFKCISTRKSTKIETQFLIAQKELIVQISFSPHKFNIGGKEQEFVLTIAKDITSEKAKEIELQRFFNIVESSLNPIQITDLSGKMIYVNPAFIKSSGYNKEELIGKNPRIFGSGKMPRKFWDKMWQTISGG